MQLFGRGKIFTDVTDINETNIEKVLADALTIHAKNAREITYLRWYVKGAQPVLERTKKVRPDICNKAVMNIAKECRDFQRGFIWGKPINLVQRKDRGSSDAVNTFNEYMFEQRKFDIDKAVANDFCICGLGYKTVMPNLNPADESPFCIAQLDPETTFCVYQNDPFKRKVLGVSFCPHEDNTITYTAYTPTKRFELVSGTPYTPVVTAPGVVASSVLGTPKLKSVTPNGIGVIPIVEYEAPDRMGTAYESCLPLLDCVNVLTSNRLDSIEQFVNSILWIHNTELDEEALKKLNDLLALQTTSTGDGTQATVKYLSDSLDQTAVQDLQKCLEEHIYEQAGVPGRVQSSGGSTGTAAEMGEAGWKKIEYIAEIVQGAWEVGERDMLQLCLAIIGKTARVPADVAKLKVTDFDVKFVRSKNYNGLTKTQTAINALTFGAHPRDVFILADMFSDPEQAYQNALESGYLDRALDRFYGKQQGSDNPLEKQTGVVQNQPQGDGGLEQAAASKGYIQKRD